MTIDINHPLYRKYSNMLTRCYNPNARSYKYYGAVGIHICKEWREDKEIFFDWAINNGWKPGLEIDRRDNRLSYYPQNCRFVTPKQNKQNKTPRRNPEHWTQNIRELMLS
jgi:hypothetical protein